MPKSNSCVFDAVLSWTTMPAGVTASPSLDCDPEAQFHGINGPADSAGPEIARNW
jgi:hypothetical protein